MWSAALAPPVASALSVRAAPKGTPLTPHLGGSLHTVSAASATSAPHHVTLSAGYVPTARPIQEETAVRFAQKASIGCCLFHFSPVISVPQGYLLPGMDLASVRTQFVTWS